MSKAIINSKDWDDSYRPEQYFTRDFLAEKYPFLEIKTEFHIKGLTLDGKPYRNCKPDIAVVEKKLIIRINGMYHYKSPRQQLKDEFQKKALEQAGWYVIDFDCRTMEYLFRVKRKSSDTTLNKAMEEIEKVLGKHKKWLNANIVQKP